MQAKQNDMERHIDINDFNYTLPDERIAKFPLENRSDSKLLVYRNGDIDEKRFYNLAIGGKNHKCNTVYRLDTCGKY